MNLSHLRYFVQLAKTGHYTRTAEQLYITQPSLSHAISQLEHELGVPLFEKAARGVTLTQFGQQFLESVQQSLAILDESVHYLQQCAKGSGIIRLGLLRTLGVDYVPKLAAEYIKLHPEQKVEFTFQSGVTFELLEKLKRREVDLVFSSKAPDEYNLTSLPVTHQDLVLIVPANHPLAAKHTAELSEILDEPFIQFAHGSGLRYVVDGLFAAIDAVPNTAYETQEDQVVAGMVANGFGIAIVPYMDMLLRLNVKILQIAKPNPDRKFFLVTDPTVTLSPAASGFRDFVLSHSPFL